MTQGVAGVVTLYDEKGNEIKVRLEDGEYRLGASDTRTHDTLDAILLVMQEIRDLLKLGMQS